MTARTMAVFFLVWGLAGTAIAQDETALRGRSIPENSIERRLRTEDLAREQEAERAAGHAQGRTSNEEVWNQPLRLARSSAPNTPDQPLWVVIRAFAEGVTFEEYPSYEEALRGVEKDDIKRGFVADRYTGAEVWNQATDRMGVFVVVVTPEGLRAIGIPSRSVTNMGSAHERQVYDIEADFDGAMLAFDIADSSTGSDRFRTNSPGHKTVGELTLRDKGFEFVATKAMTGADKFRTNSPGHKTVGELTLRAYGYAIYSTQKGLRLVVLVWDKDGNDVDLYLLRVTTAPGDGMDLPAPAENHNSTRSNRGR